MPSTEPFTLESPADPAGPPITCAADLTEAHAREKLGMPAAWRVYQWEAIGDPGHFICTKVTGAVAPVVMRGPRKGRPNWSKMDKATERTTCITPAEEDAWESRWEAETGRCRRCVGKGETIWSSSVTEGKKYRPCSRCQGTGKPSVGHGDAS